MKLWRVDDVMTRDVVGVREDTPYREIVDLLLERRISAVPVLDSTGRVVGLISESDLLLKVSDVPEPKVLVTPRYRQELGKAHGRVARDVMSAPAIGVRASLSVAAAARTMQKERVKRLVVEDDRGRSVGIVTRSDLLKVHQRPDADLRQDVDDEILRRVLAVEAGTVRTEVVEGVVTLTGRLHFRSVVDKAVRLSSQVPGVVDVVNRLSYEVDDRYAVGSDVGAPFGVA
jgi:CBS-domain-containing membrane protein